MSRKILLVDDDVDYLKSQEMFFSAAGFEVTTAESVGEAEEKLTTLRPDLAILDLMLDEQDGGFTLCHHIKKIDQTIPVIVVSAVTSETGMDFDAVTKDERSWIKADAWLAKPIRFEQLQKEVNRLLKE